MASNGYKFGKAIAGNLTIIVTGLVVVGAIFWLWPSAPPPQVADKPASTEPAPAADACQTDSGERFKNAAALFGNKKFDQAADMLYACINSLSQNERDLYVKALTEVNSARAVAAKEPTPPPDSDGWQYSDDIDQMSNKPVSFAMMESTNSLDLKFPYAGKNYGRLAIRKHQARAADVIFSIEKGQLLCHTYNGCPLKIKFDDAVAVDFTGSGSADNNSSIIFLNNAQRFITLAKKAKRIFVQANIYQSGAPVLEFYTPNPLTWKTGK